MKRLSPSIATKRYVRWAQWDRCLLCHCRLRMHFHHVIPVSDAGPNHYLNLVELCPNHHDLVEVLKREVIPHNRPRDTSWISRAEKAKELADVLPPNERAVLEILSQPHRMARVVLRELTADHVHLLRSAATDLVEEDRQLLALVNRMRPRVFLGSPANLEDLKRLDTVTLDRALEQFPGNIEPEFFADVINEHLQELGLPFEIISMADTTDSCSMNTFS